MLLKKQRLVVLLSTLALFVGTTSAFALSLSWPAVTTDLDGNPLSTAQGTALTAYNIYRCGSNSCTPANATFVQSVSPTQTTFNIDSQPRPSTYFVTAENAIGESGPSPTLRITPPRSPSDLKFQ